MPSKTLIRRSEIDIDRDTSQRKQSLEVVVIAAESLRSATSSASTDDGDGGTGDANQSSDVADYDIEDAKQASDGFIFNGTAAVAAVESAGAARAGWVRPTPHVNNRSGGRKGGESSSDKDGLFEEHL